MLLLKNAKLYGKEKRDVLVANDKIAAVEEKIEFTGLDLDIFDLEGQTLIPALIDQHVHVTGGGGEGGMATRCPELDIEDALDAGVATIVGLLGTDGVTRTIEDLLAKTKGLREYGFTAYCLTGAYQYPPPSLTGSVMKDVVFIEECIGVKTALNDHRSSHLSYGELKRLAADVRMAGLIGNKAGLVHVHMGSGKHGMKLLFDLIEGENIPALVFRPTHLGRHMEEAARLSQLGTYVDFTTTEDGEASARTLHKALSTCDPSMVTMSSDANGSMPLWNEKREMIGIGIGKMTSLYGTVLSLVKDFGYDLEQALKPCGENVARALGLYPEVGCMAPGARAHLLVLDDDLEIKDFILNGRLARSGYRNVLEVNFR